MSGRKSIQKAEQIIQKILSGPSLNFAIRLWDGTILHPPSGKSDFTLVFSNKKAFQRLILSPDAMTAGTLYIKKDVDVEGSLFKAMHLMDVFSAVKLTSREKLKILVQLITL